MTPVREWLSGLEAAGINLGLAQIRALLHELGHPERTFDSLIVAGTNGKGSVTAMVERGLRAAGRRTARYTSPHLIAIEERTVIDGEPISAQGFDAAAERVREAALRLPSKTSFFEATTAIALSAFEEARVQVAVLEVGLGGRLDATNAVDAGVAVITNIGLDHQAYLGNTIPAIAAEKAGVIKRGASVIAGHTGDAALEVLKAKAEEEDAAFIYAPSGVTVEASIGSRGSTLTLRTPDHDYGRVRLALAGRHQIDNAVTAVRTLEAVGRRGLAPVDQDAIRTALEDVRWPGRLDWRVWHGHDVLVDGAHNPDGARALADFLRETMPRPVPIVVGVMRDKAIEEILTVLAEAASVLVCTAARNERAASPEELAEIARRAFPALPCVVAATPEAALHRASDHGSPIVVAGSLFLAGDVLALVA